MVGRVLGRPVHGDQERLALSILIAQKGLPGLVPTGIGGGWAGLWHRPSAASALQGVGRPSPGVQTFQPRGPSFRRLLAGVFRSPSTLPSGHRLDAFGWRLPASPPVAGRCSIARGPSDLASSGDHRRIRSHRLHPLRRSGDAQPGAGWVRAGSPARVSTGKGLLGPVRRTWVIVLKGGLPVGGIKPLRLLGDPVPWPTVSLAKG